MGKEDRIGIPQTFDGFPGWPRKESSRAELTKALNTYLTGLQTSGLVTRVLLATDPQEGMGEVVSVLKEDPSIEDYSKPEYRELLQLAGSFDLQLPIHLNTIASFLSRSDEVRFLEGAEQKGLQVDVVNLEQPGAQP